MIIPDLCQKTEEIIERIGNRDANHSWSTWNNPKVPGKETRGIEDQKKNRDSSHHSSAEVNNNI